MPQFTNPYNTQNGMTNIGPQPMPGYPSSGWMPTGNPPSGAVNQTMGMSNQMGNQQPMQMPMQQPNTQDWKPYSPPSARPQLVGRWVSDFDEIKPQEVPMDGWMYLFPQIDWSCIHAKYWDNSGTLRSFRFLPEKNDPPAQQQIAMPPEMDNIIQGYEAIAANVADRLSALEGRVSDIYNAVSQPITATGNRVKKTVDKEEK